MVRLSYVDVVSEVYSAAVDPLCLPCEAFRDEIVRRVRAAGTPGVEPLARRNRPHAPCPLLRQGGGAAPSSLCRCG
jgi:hypothetical protein